MISLTHITNHSGQTHPLNQLFISSPNPRYSPNIVDVRVGGSEVGPPRVVRSGSAGRPALRADHGAHQPHASARAGVRPRWPRQGVGVGGADRDVPGAAEADDALVERGGLQVERQARPADKAGTPSVHPRCAQEVVEVRDKQNTHRLRTSSTGREACH